MRIGAACSVRDGLPACRIDGWPPLLAARPVHAKMTAIARAPGRNCAIPIKFSSPDDAAVAVRSTENVSELSAPTLFLLCATAHAAGPAFAWPRRCLDDFAWRLAGAVSVSGAVSGHRHPMRQCARRAAGGRAGHGPGPLQGHALCGPGPGLWRGQGGRDAGAGLGVPTGCLDGRAHGRCGVAWKTTMCCCARRAKAC